MSVTVFTGAQSDSGSSCENPVFLFSRGNMIFCLPPPVCYMHSHEVQCPYMQQIYAELAHQDGAQRTYANPQSLQSLH